MGQPQIRQLCRRGRPVDGGPDAAAAEHCRQFAELGAVELSARGPDGSGVCGAGGVGGGGAAAV